MTNLYSRWFDKLVDFNMALRDASFRNGSITIEPMEEDRIRVIAHSRTDHSTVSFSLNKKDAVEMARFILILWREND